MTSPAPGTPAHDNQSPGNTAHVRVVIVDDHAIFRSGLKADLDPDIVVAGEAGTVEEAIANLREATALYLSEFPLTSKGHPLVTMFSIPENA